MRTKITLIFILLLSTLLFAFNHPEIKWQSVTTSHFIIHYYNRTEPAVYATWKIAEESYAALSELYDYNERDKINIALADYDDYANGSTDWTNGSIIIWITDARFDLRGNNTWLRNVITHELAHVVTLEKKSKLQLFDWTFALDYESPNVGVALAEPFATTRFWPNWLAEGAAQLESARRGNDCWDSRREMLLSDAVLNGRELTLDEMGFFNHNSIGDELVYNQGFSFLKFIEARIGTPAMVRLWNESRHSALFMSNFRSYFADQTGQRLEDLHRAWLDSVKTAAKKRLPQNPTPTAPVWTKGMYNYLPKVSPDGRWWGWLTSDRDDFGRTDLIIAAYGKTDDIIRVKWALNSWDFSQDSKRVYFLKSRELSDHGSGFNDIYVLDIAAHSEQRLTRNGRFYDIAVSPDGRQIAGVQFANGVYTVKTAGPNGRDWSDVAPGSLGEPFLGLSFSPVKVSLPRPAPSDSVRDTAQKRAASDTIKADSAKKDSLTPAPKAAVAAAPLEPPEYKIATSRVINGRARICIVGLESKTLRIVGPDFGQQEFPHWGRDGRIYFEADFDGTFNIYSMLPDGSDLRRHTSAAAGMFQPFLDNNGKILCVQYSRQAFSVVSCGAAGAPYAVPQSYACSFSGVPKPRGEVIIKNQPYKARLLRPVWELESFLSAADQRGSIGYALRTHQFPGFAKWSDTAQIVFGTGIQMSRTDALDKKELAMGIMGAVVHQGVAAPDSLQQATFPMSGDLNWPGMSQHDRFGDFADRKLREIAGAPALHDAGLGRSCMNFIRHSRNIIGKVAAQGDSGTDTANSGLSMAWMPVLYPSFGLQNSQSAVTFTADVEVALAMMMPEAISAEGEALWQAQRDWYFGIAPQINVYPFYLPLSEVTIPLYGIWFNYGYQNVDIAYNLSGVSEAELSLTPDIFWTTDSTDTSNYKYPTATAVTAGLQFSHGFPLTAHSSFILRTEDSYMALFGDSLKDPQHLLKGFSSEFLNLSAGGSFVFPLWRQINGGPAYADALYGEIGYDLTFYTNKTTGYSYREALLNPNDSNAVWWNHAYVSHVLTVGTRLGFYKAYEFSRLLSAKVYWDIMRNKLGLNVSVGF
jgi:hypothetical protein